MYLDISKEIKLSLSGALNQKGIEIVEITEPYDNLSRTSVNLFLSHGYQEVHIYLIFVIGESISVMASPNFN